MALHSDITARAVQTVDFNEAAYLAAFPFVADNIHAGTWKSVQDHYERKGAPENWLRRPRYTKAMAEQALLARLASSPPPQAQEPTHIPPQAAPAPGSRYIANGLDALLVTKSGMCLVIGWADDRSAPLAGLSLQLPDGQVARCVNIARCRRQDAEAAVGYPSDHLLGYYALIELEHDAPPPAGTLLHIHCGDDTATQAARPNLVTPIALRDTVFEYLAATTYFGSPAVESFLQLQRGLGDGLLRLSKSISAEISSRAYVERYGPHDRPFRASIVVCLYGAIEYFFLQAAIFSAATGARDFEYIYICNSPELTEALQREAEIAARIYGLSFTLIVLPGNAGFGAANNAAVRLAASDRVIMLNPDVFPRDADWAVRHTALVETLPAEQTRLFGVPLFYDDGCLMHGGMFVSRDMGLSVKAEGVRQQELLRVEHYGKGAPPDMAFYQQSRRVPAVTGAFISADRHWFEKIGGFSEEYVYGHYEDADIGLKSWAAGGEVWIHNIPMWHMEGKGSVRRPAHEGGSMINRWHFTRTWSAAMHNGFLGPDPERLAPSQGVRKRRALSLA